MDQVVTDFFRRYKSIGLGGTPSDSKFIAVLQKHLGLPLPRAYQAYLLIAGMGAPPELRGSDCYGNYLFKLQEWGQELLRESGAPFELPGDAVVFLMHQGYQFFYFRADGVSDDPAVYYYFEDWSAAERRYERFSDWVALIASGTQ